MSRLLQFGVRALIGRRARRHAMSRMLRFAPLTAALVVSVGLFTWGRANEDAPAGKTEDGKEPTSSAADQTAVERALSQPADLDFVETPLKDVAASIAKKTGINVMLDNKAITDAGGSEDTPITFQLKGISLKSALRHMLTEHELNFIVDSEDVLLITSDTKAKEHVVTRVYDAHDLTAPVRKFTESQINLDSLVELITSNVDPTTWSSAGGTGSIVPFGAQLVVTQTPEIHEQIADVFAGLRDVRDTPRKVIDAGGRLGLLRGPGANILGHLQKRVDLQFQETPLKDVISALAIGQPGLTIVLDMKAITDAGGSADMPITFKAKQIRFDRALRLMLQEHELNYIVDDEVLSITSDAKAKEHVVIDYYPVGDLIDASQTSIKETADAYDRLQELITTTVAPSTWASGRMRFDYALPALPGTRLLPNRRDSRRSHGACWQNCGRAEERRRPPLRPRSPRASMSWPPITPTPPAIM